MHYTQRLLTRIKRAEQASQAAKEAVLRPSGITPAQQAILAVLTDTPGITSAELARRCLITPQTVTSTVNRLEAAGLVERRPHPMHRTLVEIHPTSRGREVFDRADSCVDALDSTLSRALSADELATLRHLLAKVTEASQDYLKREQGDPTA